MTICVSYMLKVQLCSIFILVYQWKFPTDKILFNLFTAFLFYICFNLQLPPQLLHQTPQLQNECGKTVNYCFFRKHLKIS